MNAADDIIASAVFQQLFNLAKSLTMSEMIQLKAAYNGVLTYPQLTDSLQRKLRDIGIAAIATVRE